MLFFDLGYADKTLRAGGLLLMDDFLNSSWLGVTEGTLAYLMGRRRLAPIMVGYNKLFFTTISEAPEVLTLFKEMLRDDDYKGMTEICGHSVINLGRS